MSRLNTQDFGHFAEAHFVAQQWQSTSQLCTLKNDPKTDDDGCQGENRENPTKKPTVVDRRLEKGNGFEKLDVGGLYLIVSWDRSIWIIWKYIS